MTGIVGSSPCERLVAPLLIITASKTLNGQIVDATDSIKRAWVILDAVKINQEVMTDLYVAAVGLSITYKLLPDDELL